MPNFEDQLRQQAQQDMGMFPQGDIQNLQVSQVVSQQGQVRTTTETITGEILQPLDEQRQRHQAVFGALSLSPLASARVQVQRSESDQAMLFP